jgi:hypothetical protein
MGEEGEATLGKSFTESFGRGVTSNQDRRRQRRLGERDEREGKERRRKKKGVG